MSCCNSNFIGVFCTDQNTSVFGISTIKNGVMTIKYYNTSDNSLFTGNVIASCPSSPQMVERVYNLDGSSIGELSFIDASFSSIPTDLVSNKRVVWVERDLKPQIEDSTLTLSNSFSLVGSTITLSSRLADGEILVVKFIKL